MTLAIIASIADSMHLSTAGFMEKMLTLALLRPAPLILLMVAIFYLWAYARRAGEDSGVELAPRSQVTMPDLQ